MKKYVASTTLEKADWTNSTVIDGDLVEEVTKIKELPGRDILMFGFGPVARTLLQHGLLDEIRLWVHPVLVGAGSPSDLLFREGNTSRMTPVDTRTLGSGGPDSRMKLVDNKTLASGIVILSYQPTAEGDRDS